MTHAHTQTCCHLIALMAARVRAACTCVLPAHPQAHLHPPCQLTPGHAQATASRCSHAAVRRRPASRSCCRPPTSLMLLTPATQMRLQPSRESAIQHGGGCPFMQSCCLELNVLHLLMPCLQLPRRAGRCCHHPRRAGARACCCAQLRLLCSLVMRSLITHPAAPPPCCLLNDCLCCARVITAMQLSGKAKPGFPLENEGCTHAAPPQLRTRHPRRGARRRQLLVCRRGNIALHARHACLAGESCGAPAAANRQPAMPVCFGACRHRAHRRQH